MKRIISIVTLLFIGVMLACPTTTSASTLIVVSEYEQVLNSINKEFNLELGYIPVDESKISVEEYEKNTREFAKEQRELLDYMSLREREDKVSNQIGPISRAVVTKTRTRDTWQNGQYFSITATYDVNGNQASSIRNAKLNYKTAALLTNTYIVGLTGPTYSRLDGGRTCSVSYKGTLHFNSIWGYANTTFYTEFTYSS